MKRRLSPAPARLHFSQPRAFIIAAISCATPASHAGDDIRRLGRGAVGWRRCLHRQQLLMDRAYSLLTIKALDAESRTFTRITTTPSVDRLGDVVESEGAKYRLPVPLLLHHDSKQPVGEITEAVVRSTGSRSSVASRHSMSPARFEIVSRRRGIASTLD